MINMVMLMDLHWGAISPERMQQEIEETLYKFLDSLQERVDIIVIGGDLFDSKQYLTSEVTKYAIRFMNTLINGNYAKYIVILQGTKTHDDMQLDTLNCIYNDKYSTFDDESATLLVVDKVSELGIVNNKWDFYIEPYNKNKEYDMTMLCIPEEYVLDQDEYYKPYMEKQYDFIIGHGMVDKIWYAQKNKEEQSQLTKHSSAPVFKVDDLLEHCERCYFGHVHMHKHYGQDKRFLYVGPYTRWEFGKDGDVGFQYVQYDPETKTTKERFIVNKNAQVLTTKVININESISLTDLNKSLDTMISNELKTSDKLRFIINIKSTIDNYLGIKDFIISKLGDIKSVKLVLSIDIDDQYMEDTKEALESNESKNKYLFESMDIEERIQKFLKNKKNVEYSLETIRNILNMEV